MAENVKHTPGPWLYEDECPYGRDVKAIGGQWIASVHGDHGGQKGFPSPGQCKPNARLIAAAPDLLEVVQAMAGFSGRNNNFHLKEMAKAAIAKATGDTE